MTEEYMITKSQVDLVDMFIDDITYMKKVRNAFMDVTYLETPIYTTNALRFVTSDFEVTEQ